MRRVLITGAGGRDLHDFDVCSCDDPDARVVASTVAQLPPIADRVQPAAIADILASHPACWSAR